METRTLTIKPKTLIIKSSHVIYRNYSIFDNKNPTPNGKYQVVFKTSLKCNKLSTLWYLNKLRGHSTTTWIKFYQILTPFPSSGQKLTFYILSTLCHLTPEDFLLTPTPLFLFMTVVYLIFILPVSTTYLTPGIVNEVSATFVAITHNLWPSGVLWKTFFCSLGSNFEYRGKMCNGDPRMVSWVSVKVKISQMCLFTRQLTQNLT